VRVGDYAPLSLKINVLFDKPSYRLWIGGSLYFIYAIEKYRATSTR
jgi:hypothetical protein